MYVSDAVWWNAWAAGPSKHQPYFIPSPCIAPSSFIPNDTVTSTCSSSYKQDLDPLQHNGSRVSIEPCSTIVPIKRQTQHHQTLQANRSQLIWVQLLALGFCLHTIVCELGSSYRNHASNLDRGSTERKVLQAFLDHFVSCCFRPEQSAKSNHA